jgi:uncharacterized protein YceK
MGETTIEVGLFIVCIVLFIIFSAVVSGCTSVPQQTGTQSWHAPISKMQE